MVRSGWEMKRPISETRLGIVDGILHWLDKCPLAHLARQAVFINFAFHCTHTAAALSNRHAVLPAHMLLMINR